MESPFKPVPPHEQVAPAWRLVAQALLLAVAAFVALVLFGFVEVRWVKDANSPKEDKSEAPARKEASAVREGSRSHLRRDPVTETVLTRVLGDEANVIVYRSRGAAMEFWVEQQVEGKSTVLAGTGTVIRVEDSPTDELEGLAVLVQKRDGIHVHLFSEAGTAGVKSAVVPYLKSGDGEKALVRPMEAVADISDLSGHEKRAIQIHRAEERGREKGGRRTIRVMAKVAAVS